MTTQVMCNQLKSGIITINKRVNHWALMSPVSVSWLKVQTCVWTAKGIKNGQSGIKHSQSESRESEWRYSYPLLIV